MRELLAPLSRDQSGNLPNSITTLVRHQELFARFLPYALQLQSRGRLPARDRELLVLRTAFNCEAGYEWSRHARTAAKFGISDGELERIALGPDEQEWSAHDRLLLRAADDLHRQARLSEDTWNGLADFYTEEDLIELLMLVGQYHTTAFALNSLRVALDPGFERGHSQRVFEMSGRR
jgi:4-carboxymuconolactone decarboxylase